MNEEEREAQIEEMIYQELYGGGEEHKPLKVTKKPKIKPKIKPKNIGERKTVNELTIQPNNEKEIVKVEFPTSDGMGELRFHKLADDAWSYMLDIQDHPNKTMTANKPLWKIGRNNRCDLYRVLNTNFEILDVYPKFDGRNEKENMDIFCQRILASKYELEENFKIWSKESVEKKSWFEFSGNIDNFTDDKKKETMELLRAREFLDYTVETISQLAVSQKPKVTLAFLIAFSSIQENPLNSLAQASPGMGKSRISETIYKVFPKQRRFTFDKESTPSSIARMTDFAEGAEIFKSRLMYIGDIGTEREQDMANVQALLSMLKGLMSRQEYSKLLNVKDKNDDFTPTLLELKGCGAVIVESTSKSTEAQFADRSITWTPDYDGAISNNIRRYQTEDLSRWEMEDEFDIRRQKVACGIELIYEKIEAYRKDGYKFRVFNPYGQEMIKVFFDTSDPSVGNRKINHLLEIPKIVALTNFFTNELYKNEDKKIITLVVEPEDLIFALNNLSKPMAYTLGSIPENALKYVDMVETQFFNTYEWPYTWDEYKRGVAEQIDTGQQEFIEFMVDAPSFTNKQIIKLMNVSNSTANEYMDDLETMGLIFKYKDGRQNRYYPVSDYIEKKELAGIKITQPSELEEGTELREMIEDKYLNAMRKLDERGYTKL